MSDSVPVSRTLLTMGALALVSSLAVTAFLLGRATAPTPTVVVQAPSELAAPSPRPPARQAQREVDAETAAVPASPAPTVSTAAPLHPDPDHREAVRAYFQALECLGFAIINCKSMSHGGGIFNIMVYHKR